MSNFTTGQKLTLTIHNQKFSRQWEYQGKPMFTYEIQDQTHGWFLINKQTQQDFTIGETFEVEVSRVHTYQGIEQITVKKVASANGFGGKGKSSGYVAFEPRQQASINASTAINGAIELIKADKIKFEQLVATADRIFDYIQSKVLAIDPNAYKMPVAALSTNESTNTQSTTQSSNSVAANSLKQEPAYTAVSNEDELPW